jgi:hypothetical protein
MRFIYTLRQVQLSGPESDWVLTRVLFAYVEHLRHNRRDCERGGVSLHS